MSPRGTPAIEVERFVPAPWAAGPHAQTLLARFLRPTEPPPFRRERLDTPDGDFLDVDWGPDPGPDAPVALILHGLEGSTERGYVRSVARELLVRGVRPVAMNFRGCSGEPNRSLRFYHSGETEDPTRVLSEIRSRWPHRRIGAIGFSLGGNVLLKLLGERTDGGRGAVDAAVAMSVPYDLAAGCAFLEGSRMGAVYAAYFLRSLRSKVAAKAELLGPDIDVARALRAASIREFDELVTAPLGGFTGAADYYGRCSSARFLEGIGVPTLLIHAEDDPFLPSEAVPRRAAGANPEIVLSLHARGGHVGFLAGTPRRPRFWGDSLAARYLADTLRARRPEEPDTPPNPASDVP